jgi:hypothetical protein
VKRLVGLTPQARVAVHLIPQPNGCLNWEGACSEWGYGQVNIDGKIVYVHKQIWEWANGPVPPGWEVDHQCWNRKCGNLDHLEAVPKRINGLRGTSPPAWHAQKTTCPNGHPYDAIARYLTGKHAGKVRRICRHCENARRRARYEEQQRCA